MDIYIDFINEKLAVNENLSETLWNYLLTTGVISETLTGNESFPTPLRYNIFLAPVAISENITVNDVRWAIQAFIIKAVDTFTSGGDTTGTKLLLDLLVTGLNETLTANESATTPILYPTVGWLAPTFTDTLTMSEAETVNFYQFVIQILTQLVDSWSNQLECYIENITWEADSSGNVPSFVIGGTQAGGTLNTWW